MESLMFCDDALYSCQSSCSGFGRGVCAGGLVAGVRGAPSTPRDWVRIRGESNLVASRTSTENNGMESLPADGPLYLYGSNSRRYCIETVS